MTDPGSTPASPAGSAGRPATAPPEVSGRDAVPVADTGTTRPPSLDVARVRAAFPALRSGVAHFDGPGGSQVPEPVARAVADTLVAGIANRGHVTAAERRAEGTVTAARGPGRPARRRPARRGVRAVDDAADVRPRANPGGAVASR